jgi:tetratricopeptide (TPR) repeat protein
MTYFARGLAAAHLGDTASARGSIEALAKIQERLTKSKEGYWAEQVEIQRHGVSAWTALAEGRSDEALREMKSAAEMEDGTEKSAVTPGPLATSRELLGEMLLQMKQPGAALEQFEAALQREPKRFRALYGAAGAAQANGDPDASRRYFRELLTVCERADKPGRKELVEVELSLATRASW